MYSTASTLFRPRYEYVPILTITVLHERIRPLHVDHFGLEREPEYLLLSLSPWPVTVRSFQIWVRGGNWVYSAQLAPAQNRPVHKYDVALMAPELLLHACYAMQELGALYERYPRVKYNRSSEIGLASSRVPSWQEVFIDASHTSPHRLCPSWHTSYTATREASAQR